MMSLATVLGLPQHRPRRSRRRKSRRREGAHRHGRVAGELDRHDGGNEKKILHPALLLPKLPNFQSSLSHSNKLITGLFANERVLIGVGEDRRRSRAVARHGMDGSG